MKLYINEKFLSLQKKSPVTDEAGNEKYYVQGRFAMVQQYGVYTPGGEELASVSQKRISATGKCVITRNGREIGEIVPKITLFKPKYEVKGLGWIIEGNFKQDQYSVKQDGKTIVNVQVRLFTKGNAFEIEIADGIDEVNAIAAVLTIEGFLESNVIGTAVNASVQSGIVS